MEKTKSTKITARVETITPSIAEKMLATTKSPNRKITQSKVRQYASDMQKDRWVVNGEPIIIDSAENVIDGQHRLYAAIAAGTSFESLVVRGVPAATGAFATIDTGRVRGPNDVLSIAGEHFRFELTAGLRLLIAYERDAINSLRSSKVPLLTNASLLDEIDKHPGIRESASFAANNHALRALMPKSAIVMTHWLLVARDSLLADAFFTSLADGIGLRSGDPVLVLRDRLVRNRGQKRKMRGDEVAAITIKVWNALRAKKNVSQLAWRDGEDFPRVV